MILFVEMNKYDDLMIRWFMIILGSIFQLILAAHFHIWSSFSKFEARFQK